MSSRYSLPFACITTRSSSYAFVLFSI
uniref:Uncharacterized protein n=1 Tax=Arundo donax TaxID=35708 RepID=A0A0A9F6T6_ARUDO